MMDSERWQSILDATEAMRQHASMENWEQLSDLAKKRDQLIRHYFATPISADDALKIQQDIIQIMAKDEAILGQARQTRDMTSQQQLGKSQGQRAANRYLQTSKL